MPGTKSLTKREPAQLILPTANSTATAWVQKLPTATAPDTDTEGIFRFTQDTNIIELSFFGGGTDNETFSTRIHGWRRCQNSDLYVPCLLAELLVTLDNSNPAAASKGSIPAGTELIGDTIAKTMGADSVSLLTGVATEMASARLDVYGMTWIEITFNRGAPSADSCNGWISTL